MSDFDKEAEREKLREKYGEDEEKRKATEQMSELLLKGATMTNAHCTDCGDPIFRYDGQEFCPTCQKPVARDQSAGGEADGAQGDHIEVADPSDDATVQFGDGQDAAADGQDAPDESSANGTVNPTGADSPDMASDAAGHPPAADAPEASGDADPQVGDGTREVPSVEPGRTPGAAAGESATGGESPAPAPTTDRPAANRGGPTHRGDTGESVTAELSAAESLLAETVHRFARQAADADDPRTAREHLAAAREAAEALDAVRF